MIRPVEPRIAIPGLVLVAGVLGGLGIVPSYDNVTHRVVALADTVPWSGAFLPFEMGWPIDARALRPLSVLLLKAHAAVFGVAEVAPDALRWARASAELALFGLAARAWLAQLGLRRVATLAAVSSMVLAPTLFQAWLLTELDLLGAAFLFAASALLWRADATRLHAALAIALLAVPMLLKESTALVAFGFLGGMTLLTLRESGVRRTHHLAACVTWALLWAVLVTPMLTGPSTEAATVAFADKLPLVEHNAVQLLYLVGVPATLLLVVGGLAARKPALARATGWATAAMVLLPVTVLYSHYEAVYASPRGTGAAFAVVLALGLALRARGPGAPVVACIAGSWGLLSLAGLFAPTAREDMASRIFIALAPALHALAWDAARQLRPLAPRATGALALCAAWWMAASGFNHVQDWRARNAADVVGKEHLAERHLSGSLVMFNHYVEFVDPWALQAAGAEGAHEAHFLLMPAWVGPDDYQDARWLHSPGTGPASIFDGQQLRWFYWLAPRSRMSDRVDAALVGDFTWTRREVGLFQPIVDGGHNRPEDHRMLAFATEVSPLEGMLEQMAIAELEHEVPFAQVPLMLTELPRRFFGGLAFVEDHAYEVAVHRFPERPPGDATVPPRRRRHGGRR